MLRPVLVFIAVVAVLALPACGDDDGGSEGVANQSDTQTETAPSEDALKDTSTKPQIVKGKGPGAKAGDTVTVNYVGENFSNGVEFDSSWDSGAAFPVQLGAGTVIEGWDKGLVGIKKGGRRMLTIPPEMGYGAQGYPPDIPPNETLVFVVDAVSIK